MTPTVRQLEYVIAVADHGSFSRAAESCFVTQPALSSQIQQLESQLGVPLFERGRKILVTEAGVEIVRRARDILRQVEALSSVAHRFQEPLSGDLRFGVIPTVAPYTLPRILPVLAESYPGLRILLYEGQTPELVKRLGDGKLDVALLAMEADLGDCVQQSIFRDPFWLAVPGSHELASHETVTEQDLWALRQEILLLEEGHCLSNQALKICGQQGLKGIADFRAGSLGTLIQMVASGVGATLLPQMAAEVIRESSPSLSLIPFSEPTPYRSIGLVWRSSSPRAEEFPLLDPLIARAMCRN